MNLDLLNKIANLLLVFFGTVAIATLIIVIVTIIIL